MYEYLLTSRKGTFPKFVPSIPCKKATRCEVMKTVWGRLESSFIRSFVHQNKVPTYFFEFDGVVVQKRLLCSKWEGLSQAYWDIEGLCGETAFPPDDGRDRLVTINPRHTLCHWIAEQHATRKIYVLLLNENPCTCNPNDVTRSFYKWPEAIGFTSALDFSIHWLSQHSVNLISSGFYSSFYWRSWPHSMATRTKSWCRSWRDNESLLEPSSWNRFLMELP